MKIETKTFRVNPGETVDLQKWPTRVEPLYKSEVKFFLHLSKDEQRDRFLARIDEPQKNWKFSLADVEERKLWDQYQHVYEACMTATSSEVAPWHIVPADDKENARLMISEIIIEVFKSLQMAYPELSADQLEELKVVRAKLVE